MRYAVETDYKLLLRNFVQYKTFMVLMFSLIAITASVVGYFTPKKYASYATLLLDGKTIIAPLMKGAAVSAETNDWSMVAEEIISSRKSMTRLMRELGYIEDGISSEKDEVLLDKLRKNTKVALTGNDNYLQIGFKDTDPYFAKEVATHLTDIFIDATHGARADESQEAFEFIDIQVSTYHEKLLIAEEQLKEFKNKRLSEGTSSEASVSDRIQRLQNIIDKSTLELKEARIKRSSLKNQMESEVQTTISLGRQSQYFKRLTALQDKMASLRLQYRDTHPDIVNIQYQIDDLKRRIQEEKGSESSEYSGLGDGIKTNKIYQDIRMQLGEVNTRIATLETRISVTRENIAKERKKGKSVHTSDAELAELTRTYNVNKKIYEDLLKRREAARVSKEIDEQHKGLSIKVYEPAYLPLKPSGLRFFHFVLLGLLFGGLAPAALLYMYQLVDNNIKSLELLKLKEDVPVIGSMPDVLNSRDMRAHSLNSRLIYVFLLLVFLLIGAIGYLKLIHAG
jgi:polysaccharide chain length determinant protein (PEP-CTERM system associated)